VACANVELAVLKLYILNYNNNSKVCTATIPARPTANIFIKHTLLISKINHL